MTLHRQRVVGAVERGAAAPHSVYLLQEVSPADREHNIPGVADLRCSITFAI